MTSYQRADASFDQVSAQLPPESKASFTSNQLDALKLAFRQVNWKSSHTIHIRLSIPLINSGLYIVFLAGQERRSLQRLRSESPQHRRKTIVELATLAVSISGVAAAGYAALQFAAQATQRDAIHPTAIPWLQSSQACEQTGRSWQDNKCWDTSHSPDF